MQKNIDNEVHLGNSVTPFESMGKSSAINKTASDFDNVSQKVKKNKKFDKNERI